jgi:hypothetical protein
MKLKSDNQKVLQKSVRDLDSDLRAITKEHNAYGINGSEEEIEEWFHCLPIESLRESIDFENKVPRTKYSLQDMKRRFALRKTHEKKKDELEKKKSELQVSKIDDLIACIERIQNGKYTRRNSTRKSASGQEVGRTKS